MTTSQWRTESCGWVSTAYHEAGHAVAILLLGGELLLVEAISHTNGYTLWMGTENRLAQLVDIANERRRISSELIRLWLDEFWIADAGVIADTEFNLVSDDQLVSSSMCDALMKYALIPSEDEHPFVKDYFHRHIGCRQHLITEDCRNFFRMPRISAMTRTLAEALLRTRRMEGWEVIDTLLANHSVLTGQIDLFWDPTGDDAFPGRLAVSQSRQLHLFS